MRYLLLPVRLVYVAYASVMFVLTMFVVIPFVIVGSFFGRLRGGNFIYRVCNLWGDVWFFIVGINHRNIHEQPMVDKPFIYVANHVSYLDAAVIVKTVRRPVRALGKIEMGRIPFFGYIYKKAIVTVDRSNPENRARSVRVLTSVLKKGISIFIFPEGTFNKTHRPLKEFFDGAFKISIETQTPIKPILFLDTYDRMKSFFLLNPGRCRAIFLPEIEVKGLTMKDVGALKQKVFLEMEKKLYEYNASWILKPKTDTLNTAITQTKAVG